MDMDTWSVIEDILSIFLYSKSVHPYSVRAVLNSWDNFDNVIHVTALLPWLKATHFCHFCRNVMKLSTFACKWMDNYCVQYLSIVLEELAKSLRGLLFWRARYIIRGHAFQRMKSWDKQGTSHDSGCMAPVSSTNALMAHHHHHHHHHHHWLIDRGVDPGVWGSWPLENM